jgi:Mg-chelatase subunit ChlD
MRRSGERGAILPIILGGMLLLSTLFYGGLTMLRIVVARHEVQRAADAAVLVAANSVKHEGLRFDAVKQGKAQEVASRNSSQNLVYQWTTAETPDRVDIQVRVTADVSAPMFIFPSGKLQVSATAKGTAGQQTVTEAEKKYPKLVLVLDFSGSMRRPPGDDGDNFLPITDTRNSYHVLRRAVNLLLDFNFDIKYGLVLFAATVFKTVPIDLGNISVMRTEVNGNHTCPGGSNCTTNSWDGLKAAGELFTQSEGDEARYVLFVTDGQPNTNDTTVQQGITKSKAEVEKLWNLGATIYTIHIVNTKDQVASLREFMRSISGPPDKRGDPEYYFDADSEQKLSDLFASIGSSLACQIGPLSPTPPDPKKMHVFVRADSGDETALIDSTRAEGLPPAVKPGDLWSLQKPFHDGNFYFYKEENGIIYVTPPLCERILTHKHPVLVRWVSPTLSE